MCVHFLGRRTQSFPHKPRAGGASCQGAAAPSGPHRPAKLYASARATMRARRIEEAALGPLVPPLGRRAGRARWLQTVAIGCRPARSGGTGCKKFQFVTTLFHPPRKSSHAGPRGSKAGLPWTGRRSAPYGNAEKKRNPFGRNSVLVRLLFGIVPVCSASSFEVKLMEEFLKYSEIASARPPRPTVGGHLRQIATHCGDLRYQPKPRRHSAADNGRVRSRDLRANRETSPGEIHGA